MFSTVPIPKTTRLIGDAFTWSHYPMLENVLMDHMEEYYKMRWAPIFLLLMYQMKFFFIFFTCFMSISWTCAQSKEQQLFNNRLVRIIYHTASINGYTFDPEIYSGGEIPLTQRGKKNDSIHEIDSANITPLPINFNWKKLRDRIRCYYKTNVQNSKKRLATMLKNPSKTRNKDALIRVIGLTQDEPHLKMATSLDYQSKSVNHRSVSVTGGDRPLRDGKLIVGADVPAVLKRDNVAVPTKLHHDGKFSM